MSVELIHGVPGVPDYSKQEFAGKQAEYCLLIPIINEGERILTELDRIQKAGVMVCRSYKKFFFK